MDKTVMVISHTHWDRQWYKTVQEFKIALCSMMDSLFDLLQSDPDFHVFHLDGQTAVIRDYLSLRPEQEELVRKMIRDRRIKIGPWFVQPDNVIVPGEGIIRNLLKGTRYARSMGECSFSGWLPDSFGHCAQLPQILTNFGIGSFIFSRGLGDHLEGTCEFIWESPGGDYVTAVFQKGGYYGGGNLAYPFFWGNIDDMEPDHELARMRLQELIALYGDMTSSHIIPVWNGADHTAPERTLPATVEYLNRTMPGFQVMQGSIDEYVSALEEKKDTLKRVTGELRGARYEPILASVLSTRMHIKQKNYVLQRSLERITEPACVLAQLYGASYPKHALDEAWTCMLENHFHDAVCGCSKDQVHREMEYGFSKAEQTSHELSSQAAAHIAGRLKTDTNRQSTGFSCSSLEMLYINPLVHEHTGTAETSADLPYPETHWHTILGGSRTAPVQVSGCSPFTDMWLPKSSTAGSIVRELSFWQQYFRFIDRRAVVQFSIDHTGPRPLLKLLLGSRILEPRDIVEQVVSALAQYPGETVFDIEARYYRINFLIPVHLPAFGYASVPLSMQEHEAAEQAEGFPAVTAGPACLENRYIRVDVSNCGTADILCKEGNFTLHGVHVFQDQGDRGDTYDFCPVSGEDGLQTILKPESVSVTLEEQGPVRGCISVACTFDVPSSLQEDDRDARETALTALHVNSRIMLSWDARYVEIVTTVLNTAKDHRLRMYVPTGMDIQEAVSDGQFCMHRRNTRIEKKAHWAFSPASVFPHERWAAAGNGTRGVAVFSEGLPEHAVEKSPKGDYLALTLLRCVGWLSRQDIAVRPGHAGPPIPTPDAQCLGAHTFRYGIYLFSGAVEESGIIEASAHFDSQILWSQTANPPQNNPRELSLIALEPAFLQMSALKISEDGQYICLRFWNPGDDEIRARLFGELKVTGVWKSRADEEPLEKLAVSGPELNLSLAVKPHEIVTLLITPVRE